MAYQGTMAHEKTMSLEEPWVWNNHAIEYQKIKYCRPRLETMDAHSVFFIQKLKFLLNVIQISFQFSTLCDYFDCGLLQEFYALIVGS